MLSLAGAVLVVLACGGVGLLVAANYRRRPEELCLIVSGLQMLETEIGFAATPLPEALEHVAQGLPQPVGGFFQTAAVRLRDGLGGGAAAAWQAAVGELAQESALDRDDRRVLLTLGPSLGVSDREEQLKHLALTREQLKRQVDLAEGQRAKNERLWRSMGFLVGLMLALVLF